MGGKTVVIRLLGDKKALSVSLAANGALGSMVLPNGGIRLYVFAGFEDNLWQESKAVQTAHHSLRFRMCMLFRVKRRWPEGQNSRL